MFYKYLATTIATVALSTTIVSAQTAPSADDVVASAKNQLGVLEYCKAKGYVDAATIDIQTKLMGMLPPASDASKVDAAYQKGKNGTVSSMGQEVNLADVAKAQNTAEETMCKQIGAAVNQAAAMLPK